VISGWFESPGVRPKGAPVALTQARDGSIWIADDKNHSILRIANYGGVVGPTAVKLNFGQAVSEIANEIPALTSNYNAVVSSVLKSPQCVNCHDNYILPNDSNGDGMAQMRYLLSFGTWIKLRTPDTASLSNENTLSQSTLYTKLIPAGSSAMPPIDRPYANLQNHETAIQLVKNFVESFPNTVNLRKVKAGKTAAITGTPGSAVCANIPAGKHLLVVNGLPQTLGGKEVLELKINVGTGVVKQCGSATRFWTLAENLELFFK
jgi:hypothetical protein